MPLLTPPHARFLPGRLTPLGSVYNHVVMEVMTEGELDRAFAALADPTRRAIVARLARGEAGVLDLAAPFPVSQPAISKHLKVLEAAGLVTRRRDAQRRLCRLQPQRLKQLSDWVGSYREFWEESYSRLDDYLARLDDQGETT